MKWDDIGDQPCSVARMLSVIGDRWTMLILRNALWEFAVLMIFKNH